MPGDPPISIKDFGASFKGFLDQITAEPGKEPVFLAKLAEHFGTSPRTLPIVGDSFGLAEHPNLQIAIDAYLAGPDRSAELLGVIGGHDFMPISLAELLTSRPHFGAVEEGPVQHVNVELADGERLRCTKRGLFLIRDAGAPFALFVAMGDERYRPMLKVEVMAVDVADAERLLGDLRTTMRKRNVYRGHVVSLTVRDEQLAVQFHHLPNIQRDQIILPAGVLDRIERQTIRFGQLSDRLLAAGRHLRRGLLLYGPPGTGKTLTAMYLARQMRDRTVLLIAGQASRLIHASCAMARVLQPAVVILEDVDLIAEERTRPGAQGCSPLLFELLNEMDGLSDDADVLFVLTTNRPDILEPALAARPGRIDQAIEIALPDRACRRRLLDLYASGLRLADVDLADVAARAEGVSAAFIRELLRRAALFAADEGNELVVTNAHVSEALHDLIVQGGELTRSLLGARSVPT